MYSTKLTVLMGFQVFMWFLTSCKVHSTLDRHIPTVMAARNKAAQASILRLSPCLVSFIEPVASHCFVEIKQAYFITIHFGLFILLLLGAMSLLLPLLLRKCHYYSNRCGHRSDLITCNIGGRGGGYEDGNKIRKIRFRLHMQTLTVWTWPKTDDKVQDVCYGRPACFPAMFRPLLFTL